MGDRARMLRVIGAIGAALAVVAIFVAWSVAAHNAAGPGDSAETSGTVSSDDRTGESAAGTDAPVPSGSATASPDAGTKPGAASGEPGVQPDLPAVPVRAPRIAYRRAGWVCVSAEDGTDERRVAASESGVFALSPDGATIALVDAAAAQLALVEVATARTVAVGPAEQDRPSWAPDSSWLAYTATGPHVRRVGRDGAGGATLFAGSLPAVAGAGPVVVGAAESGAPGIVVWRAGTISRITVAAPLAGLACDVARVYYGTAPTGTGSAMLGAVGLDGRDGVVLATSLASARMISVCDLRLSPDGARIAYAECGDDGYSRTLAVAVTGGRTVAFTVRRDTYPLDWTADSAWFVFVEGNAFQGEATAVLAAAADGSRREKLVEGAGR